MQRAFGFPAPAFVFCYRLAQDGNPCRIGDKIEVLNDSIGAIKNELENRRK
jgi:hypothetical protein